MFKKSIAFGIVFLGLLTSANVSAQVIIPGPPPPRPVVVVQAPPRPKTVIVQAPAAPVKVVKVKRNRGHHYGKHHKRKVVVIQK